MLLLISKCFFRPLISPSGCKPPVYKPTQNPLRTCISPGLIGGSLRYSNIFKPDYILFILTRNQLSSVVREGTEVGATVMEKGVNLSANFPLSSPFFFTREICGRPRKIINFAGKPVLKIILYGNGLTQGYSTYGGSK